MFGRAGDIDALCARALDRGITFVTGRPQMGKTWVLQELGRSLAYDEKRWSSGQPKYLVGYHECLDEEDQLLRVVSDLYTRWLSAADHAQQARQLWQSSQGQRTGIVATAVGTLFEKLNPTKPVGLDLGGLVKETLNGLVAANERLTTGGLQTPKLSHDVARDLVAQLAGLARQRVVLILDGWDQSRTLEHERRLLESVIKHAEGWPDVHIFVGVRHPEISETKGDSPAYDAACRLAAASATVAIHELKPLASLADPEQTRLLTTIRGLLPSGARVEDAELLGLLDGYPGVLARWRDSKSKLSQAPDVLQALKGYAADAQSYRYREFDVLLPQLRGDALRLAIRLALVPRLDESTWKVLQPILNDGLPPDTWRQLVRDGVLDRATRNFPSYGHDTRYRAIRQKLLSHETLGADVLAEAEALLLSCGGQIRSVDPALLPFVAAVLAVAEVVPAEELSGAAKLTILALLSLLGKLPEFPDFSEAAAVASEYPILAPLLAMGLVNAIVDANPDAQAARDTLLGELRQMQVADQTNATVREQLAKGLFSAMNDEKGQVAVLMNDLRQLQTDYPDDSTVRAQLAKGLVNAMKARDAEDQMRLLGEIRQMQVAYPADAAVRESFARGQAVIGVSQAENGEYAEAEEALRASIRLFADDAPTEITEGMGQLLTTVMPHYFKVCRDGMIEPQPWVYALAEQLGLLPPEDDDPAGRG